MVGVAPAPELVEDVLVFVDVLLDVDVDDDEVGLTEAELVADLDTVVEELGREVGPGGSLEVVGDVSVAVGAGRLTRSWYWGDSESSRAKLTNITSEGFSRT